MRIAMIAACPFPWPRGTPIRIHRLAEALAQRGHELHVVTYHLGDRELPLPFAVHRIRDVPSYRDCRPGPSARKLLQLDPRLAARLAALLRSQRFDLVHAHHYEGLLAARLGARGARPPIVYDAHTLLASELPYYALAPGRLPMAWIGRALDRWLPPLADRVIAVSDEIRDALVAHRRIGPERIAVIPNGIEYEHFAPPARPDPGARRSPRLVFAGNLAAYQRIDLLLAAFAAVCARLPGVRLQLLTESDFAPHVALAARLGVSAGIEVARADYAALPALLHGADVLLNPRTDCDGLPQKLLNYMAAGRPIVSFAGSAKLLEHGRTGLIAPDGDVTAFADAVLRVLADPALGRALGACAQEKVRAEHGWNRAAARVEAVYAELIARGAASLPGPAACGALQPRTGERTR